MIENEQEQLKRVGVELGYSKRCIKQDRNYLDNLCIIVAILVSMVGVAVWMVIAWSRDMGVIALCLPLGLSIITLLYVASYTDVISARWCGIGYHRKMILPGGVRLMFDTRSYDDHKFIFERHLTVEGLEFTSNQVSIMYAIITVVLKRDIDYLKLIECIEQSEREISLSITQIQLANKNHDEEYKRFEETIKLMDEKNKDRYCKKY